MGWVRLHPYNISQKVEIVVEHYRQHVAPLLKGEAKAMVVVGSRQEAVRWQLTLDKYIKSRGYTIRTLVAFSGEVTDKESGPDPFTENSKELNPNLRGRDIREAFKGTSTKFCSWRTNSKPDSINRCCAASTSISDWPASKPCKRCRG